MPTTGNPFYVHPGMDMGPGLKGLGDVMQANRKAAMIRDEKARVQGLRDEAAALYRAGDTEALAEFMIANPDVQKGVDEAHRFYDDETRKDFFESVMTVRDIVSRDPTNREAVEATVNARIEMLQRRGVAPSQWKDTMQFMEQYDTEMAKDPTGQGIVDLMDNLAAVGAPKRFKEFKEAMRSGEDTGAGAGVAWGLYKAAVDEGWLPEDGSEPSIMKFEQEMAAAKQPPARGQRAGTPFLVRDPEGNVKVMATTFDPEEGSYATEEMDVAEGTQFLTKLGETGAEASARAAEQAGETTSAKAEATRQAGIITSGVAAAESTAYLRRALELLDNVETGGIDYLKYHTKRMFGVESEDEGELSGLMGKAVLSQLRETFGAQFTEQEGKRLERIEANMGKSMAANKALLNQALSVANRAAGRAIDAAKARGDTRTVQDIEELLEFRLGIDEAGAAVPGDPSPEGSVELPGGVKIIGIRRK
jgi:hypothetical protein